MLPKTRSPSVLSHREAEKAQVLVPLLLWMEYTYVILFPAIALTSVYFVDHSMKVWQALLCFSLLFFLWQRYVMLWLYGKSQFDSDGTYFSFIIVWGFVLSQCAASFAVWAYRLQEITEWPFAILIFVLIFFLTFFIYLAGILYIEWSFSKAGKALDNMDGADPGYGKIMEDTGISWWNVNPIYVLKHRLCPKERGYEVHDETVACWPSWSNQGFFEKGKEARHRKRDSWRDQAARDEPAAVTVAEATKGASINGAGGANGELSTQSSPPDRLISSAARTIPVGFGGLLAGTARRPATHEPALHRSLPLCRKCKGRAGPCGWPEIPNRHDDDRRECSCYPCLPSRLTHYKLRKNVTWASCRFFGAVTGTGLPCASPSISSTTFMRALGALCCAPANGAALDNCTNVQW